MRVIPSSGEFTVLNWRISGAVGMFCSVEGIGKEKSGVMKIWVMEK